jgi:hypothetical protein
MATSPPSSSSSLSPSSSSSGSTSKLSKDGPDGVTYWAASKIIGKVCKQEVESYTDCCEQIMANNAQLLPGHNSNNMLIGTCHNHEEKVAACSIKS